MLMGHSIPDLTATAAFELPLMVVPSHPILRNAERYITMTVSGTSPSPASNSRTPTISGCLPGTRQGFAVPRLRTPRSRCERLDPGSSQRESGATWRRVLTKGDAETTKPPRQQAVSERERRDSNPRPPA